MFCVALAQLRHTVGRTIALLAAIAVATASFTVLTGEVETTRLQVRGTVEASFRSSYDLLIRPVASATPQERNQGLVRPNYQSGIFGGITLAQLDAVRATPGVEVAAPVSNLGYVNVRASVRVNLKPFLDGADRQLFRVRPTFTMDRGLSRFEGTPLYVYVSRHRAAAVNPADAGLGESALDVSAVYAERIRNRRAPVSACTNYAVDKEAVERERAPQRFRSHSSPWGYRDPYAGNAVLMRCYYLPTRPNIRIADGASDPSQLDAVIPVSLPVLLTAIDPVAENAISKLDRSIVGGRNLSSTDDGVPASVADHPEVLTRMPVLASTSVSIDQQVVATVERVDSAPSELSNVLGKRSGLLSRLNRLPGSSVTQLKPVSAQDMWSGVLDSNAVTENDLQIGYYWQVGSSSFQQRAGALQIDAVPNPGTSYESPEVGDPVNPAPVGSDDNGVRAIEGHARQYEADRVAVLKVVGRYDPSRVMTDAAASGLVSPTYTSPLLPGADEASRTALRNSPLAPSSNIAGYAAQPPTLLTTLPAAKVLLNTVNYGDPRQLGPGVGGERPDPISVIRVRVAGITGSDPVSRERLNQAALAIADRTGLAVDIVAGSSGVPTTVVVPAGEHGRPELRLTEVWARKGLAYEIVAAVDRKSLALFLLILTVCALMVANAAAAAIRTRRTELGLLACLGWGAGRLYGLVLTELALVGLAAGVLGAGIALVVGMSAGVSITPQRALLAVPPAVVLALLAGMAPAVRASRATPMDAVRPLVRAPHRAGRVDTMTRMALRSLGRTPGRTALAATSLALGTAALTVLLVVHQVFRGVVVGSLLGDVVALQVRKPDLVALAAIIALGVAAVVDVLYLNIREQAGELAMLRSTGWPEPALARLVAVQGLGIGVLGSVAGAMAGGLMVWALTRSFDTQMLIPLSAAVGTGVVVAMLAAVGPALLIGRLPTATLLSQDDL